jgi:hypothetical protein
MFIATSHTRLRPASGQEYRDRRFSRARGNPDTQCLPWSYLPTPRALCEVLLWLGSAGAANATPGVGTLFIESDDLRKDFADLKAHGVEFLEPEPEDYPFGTRVTAFDPDGNPVALRQTRKR